MAYVLLAFFAYVVGHARGYTVGERDGVDSAVEAAADIRDEEIAEAEAEAYVRQMAYQGMMN